MQQNLIVMWKGKKTEILSYQTNSYSCSFEMFVSIVFCNSTEVVLKMSVEIIKQLLY